MNSMTAQRTILSKEGCYATHLYGLFSIFRCIDKAKEWNNPLNEPIYNTFYVGSIVPTWVHFLFSFDRHYDFRNNNLLNNQISHTIPTLYVPLFPFFEYFFPIIIIITTTKTIYNNVH